MWQYYFLLLSLSIVLYCGFRTWIPLYWESCGFRTWGLLYNYCKSCGFRTWSHLCWETYGFWMWSSVFWESCWFRSWNLVFWESRTDKFHFFFSFLKIEKWKRFMAFVWSYTCNTYMAHSVENWSKWWLRKSKYIQLQCESFSFYYLEMKAWHLLCI